MNNDAFAVTLLQTASRGNGDKRILVGVIGFSGAGTGIQRPHASLMKAGRAQVGQQTVPLLAGSEIRQGRQEDLSG
jgi:hypothetical protein